MMQLFENLNFINSEQSLLEAIKPIWLRVWESLKNQDRGAWREWETKMQRDKL